MKRDQFEVVEQLTISSKPVESVSSSTPGSAELDRVRIGGEGGRLYSFE